MVIFILLVLGLCFGSFVNALVWRLRQQSLPAGKSKSRKAKPSTSNDYSITRGRSMCPQCHHQLAAADLIPVISWLLLRGKCRYCKKPIEDSPLVEVLTVLLFISSYVWWPYGFDRAGMLRFGLWLVFVVGFVALAVYDLRWMTLPNKIVYPLLGLAIVQVLLLAVLQQDWLVLVRAGVGLLCLGGLFYVLFQISGGKWIGGGDVKLGFILGLLVGGPFASLLLLFLAATAGSLVALPLMVLGRVKHSTRIPFGPFLLASTIVVYLFGPSLLRAAGRLFVL